MLLAADPRGDTGNSSPQLRRGPDQGAGDDVVGTVPSTNLSNALVDGHPLPVRAGGHVAVDKGVSQIARRRGELAKELTIQTTLGRLDHGARVMSNETAQQLVSTMLITQIARSVKRVKASQGDTRAIADVMLPGRCDQEL